MNNINKIYKKEQEKKIRRDKNGVEINKKEKEEKKEEIDKSEQILKEELDRIDEEDKENKKKKKKKKKKENKNISKDNYEFEGLPNVNEDEYDKYFIKEDEIEIFFSSNNEFVEIFKNNVFIWALKLAKLIKDKFSRKDPYLLPKKKIDKISRNKSRKCIKL